MFRIPRQEASGGPGCTFAQPSLPPSPEATPLARLQVRDLGVSGLAQECASEALVDVHGTEVLDGFIADQVSSQSRVQRCLRKCALIPEEMCEEPVRYLRNPVEDCLVWTTVLVGKEGVHGVDCWRDEEVKFVNCGGAVDADESFEDGAQDSISSLHHADDPMGLSWAEGHLHIHGRQQVVQVTLEQRVRVEQDTCVSSKPDSVQEVVGLLGAFCSQDRSLMEAGFRI